jgi:hypothetical protein
MPHPTPPVVSRRNTNLVFNFAFIVNTPRFRVARFAERQLLSDVHPPVLSQFARAVLYILAQSALMRFSSIFALGHGSQSKLRPSLANANSLRVSSSARWVVAPTRTYTPSSLPSDFTKYGHFEPPMTSTAITDFPSMFSIPTSIGTRGEQPFMMELTMPSISANT